MGTKVKKEVKKTVNTEDEIISKFTLAIPSMGLIMMATMGTYLSSPLIAANQKASMMFMALMAVGAFFAFCAFTWRVKIGKQGVTIQGVPCGEKTLFYDAIKKVEVRKWGESVISFTVVRKNDRKFVRVYAVMTNCGAMLERLGKLGVKIVEV